MPHYSKDSSLVTYLIKVLKIKRFTSNYILTIPDDYVPIIFLMVRSFDNMSLLVI